AAVPIEPAASRLLDRFGEFQAKGAVTTEKMNPQQLEEALRLVGVSSFAKRVYISRDGNSFEVSLLLTSTGSRAYALLSVGRNNTIHVAQPVDIGVGGFSVDGALVFVRGNSFVTIDQKFGRAPDQLTRLGEEIARSLDPGENDIPAVVKHMP